MKIFIVIYITFHELMSLEIIEVFFEDSIDRFLRKLVFFHHRFLEYMHLYIIENENNVFECINEMIHLKIFNSFKQDIKSFIAMSFDCFIDISMIIQMSNIRSILLLYHLQYCYKSLDHIDQYNNKSEIIVI